MRVLVTGGRDYADRKAVARALDPFIAPDLTIIHGGANGVDALASAWALPRHR